MKFRLSFATFLLMTSCLHGVSTSNRAGVASSLPADRDDGAIIRIVSIAPAPGAEVKVDTIYEATVEYEILEFNPAVSYHLLMQFDSTTHGKTIGPRHASVSDTSIRERRGRRSYRVVMADNWLMDRLAKPVRVRFYMTMMHDQRRSSIIGRSKVVEYR